MRNLTFFHEMAERLESLDPTIAMRLSDPCVNELKSSVEKGLLKKAHGEKTEIGRERGIETISWGIVMLYWFESYLNYRIFVCAV